MNEPEPAGGCRLTRDATAVITAVDPSIADILGWQPDDVIGHPSTRFVHPEDQASAVSAWFDMIAEPGSSRTWRGRYRTASGDWQWVETVNTSHLDDPHDPVVVTVMTRIAVAPMTMAEELRAREQVLTRLADALPVGIFQIDTERRITFTNDRLHGIIATPGAATAEEQLAGVVTDDLDALNLALETVLDNRAVDDLELRFAGPFPDAPHDRICVISLRPLTDDAGTVTGAIGCLTDVTDKVQLRRELEVRAAVDELTGCLNRSAILQLVELTISRLATAGSGLAVLFVDLDRFKDVNDQFGHAAGDRVLVDTSAVIRSALRGDDRVGRIGGDEFLVLCPNVENVAHARDVALRVAAAIRRRFEFDGHRVDLDASIGVAWTPTPCSADGLIARADQAMYQSKLAGRATVTVAADSGDAD